MNRFVDGLQAIIRQPVHSNWDMWAGFCLVASGLGILNGLGHWYALPGLVLIWLAGRIWAGRYTDPLLAAGDELADKLWVLRCDSRDDKGREAAEKAIDGWLQATGKASAPLYVGTDR